MKTMLGGVDIGSADARRGLLFSLGDGMLWQVMFTLVETFSVAAALSLKAPAIAIAMLGSLPMLLGSYAQVFTLSKVDPQKSRKGYVLFSVRLQIVFLLAAACAGFLPQEIGGWIFVASLALYGLCQKLFENLWLTWFSDLVPSHVLGRHTAWRSLFLSTTQFVVALGVGILARKLTVQTAPWSFFVTLFLIAAIVRFGCSLMLTAQHEPLRKKPFVRLSFRNFRPSRELLLYALAMGLFQGAAGMSGPFFSVWFLRDLRFDYLTFTIASACTTLGSMASLSMWGKLTDKIGTVRVLRIAVFMAALVPLPYLLWGTPLSVWIFNFYSGIGWTGIGVAGFKYQLQVAGDSNPEQSLTFYGCIFATISFLLSILGGFLSTRLPNLFGYQIQTLFLLSGILRLVVYFALFFKLRELDKTPPVSIGLGQAFLQSINFWWLARKD